MCVKWALNIACLAATFCSLRTNARQGYEVQHNEAKSGQLEETRFGLWYHAVLDLHFTGPGVYMTATVCATTWLLPHRVPQSPTEGHLNPPRAPRHNNSAL
jgi:hypothetical protein